MTCNHCKINEVPPDRSAYCCYACQYAAALAKNRENKRKKKRAVRDVYPARRPKMMRPVKQPFELTMKDCLKCDEPFLNEWIGNRICPACTVKNSNYSVY
jgi:uncharacterized Zn ribbon protein